MDFKQFQEVFNDVLIGKMTDSPYDDPKEVEYVLLNQKRQNRWLKQGVLLDELKEKLLRIKEKQLWVLISEPHCGDSAHIAPFVKLLSEISPLIELQILLRDSGSEIEKYLYNDTRSIPILIIRDEKGKDLSVWGPRPAELIKYRKHLLAENSSKEDLQIKIQQWYNQDKGVSFQHELMEIITNIDKKITF